MGLARRRRTNITTDAQINEEAGEDPPETGPQRRCFVTRLRHDKAGMIRFVVSPDRVLVPDLAAKLPGRGMWLSARGDVIETARLRGGFARAAKGPVSVPADLVDILRAGLVRRVLDTIGLARRAGHAVCGFQKVREWLAAGRVGLLVQASDGSQDEAMRLRGGRDVAVVAPLPAARLAAAFGRDHVVHVAIGHGPLAMAIRIEAERLAGIAGPDLGQDIGFKQAGA